MPIFTEEEAPCTCPSYIDTTIVDQAVPFIIFLSRLSKLQDRLSASSGIDTSLEAWRGRLQSQRYLLSILEKQLHERRQRIDGLQHASAWTGSIPTLLRRGSSRTDRIQQQEDECRDIENKIKEVEDTIARSQSEIDLLSEALAEREELQAACTKKQGKLDRIYETVFVGVKHEYTEESAAKRALTSAITLTETCFKRLASMRSAYELLEEALPHAVRCARALEIAQMSRTQGHVMPTSGLSSYTSILRSAIAHEKSLSVFLQLAKASDSRIGASTPKLPNLSEVFSGALDPSARRPHEPAASIWSTGVHSYNRISEVLPIMQRVVRSLSREHLQLNARLRDQQSQLSLARRQVVWGRDKLNNVRKTIFIDTLLCQDPDMVVVAIEQEDPYTLLQWLKDADEAGRLSKPTAAALSQAVRHADEEDLPDYCAM